MWGASGKGSDGTSRVGGGMWGERNKREGQREERRGGQIIKKGGKVEEERGREGKTRMRENMDFYLFCLSSQEKSRSLKFCR